MNSGIIIVSLTTANWLPRHTSKKVEIHYGVLRVLDVLWDPGDPKGLQGAAVLL